MMSSRRELEFEIEEIKKAQAVFRAINHGLRQKIMLLIHKNQEMTVTPIYKELGREQSVVSSHLAILRKAEILKTRKIQRFVNYSVDYERLRELHRDAAKLLEFEEDLD